MNYREQLIEKRQIAKKRLSDAQAAGKFKADVHGKIILELIDNEISQLVTSMTAPEPLPQSAYLDAHGGVKALRRVRREIEAKEAKAESAQYEVEQIDEQLKAFDAQK